MKYTSIILAIYLLGLVILPCGNSFHQLSVLFSGCDMVQCDALEQDSKDCKDEPCSPFCDCTCCVKVLDFSDKKPLQFIAKLSPPLLSPQFQPKLVGILSINEIWQPPRFV